MAKKLNVVKGSPEFDASVGGHKMFTYYVPGCCALRALHGIDGKDSFDYSTRPFKKITNMPTPQQVVEGIVRSGCGGSTMIMTDAYRKGDSLTTFKEFVERNKLGVLTISPGKTNYYTHAMIFTGVYEYSIEALTKWCRENVEGMKEFGVHSAWKQVYEAADMDEVFYQMGGRPQNENESSEDDEGDLEDVG